MRRHHARPLARLCDRLREIVARLRRDDRGTVAIMAAVFFSVAIAATAVSVDVAALYLERRQAQNAVDLAAIAAARDLDHATAAATATLRANGIVNPRNLSVVLGNYVADPDLAAASRFRPNVTPFNAARVRFDKPGQIYFARSFTSDCCTIGVSALGASPGLATFSIGSGLLSFKSDDAVIVNGLLKGTLGGNVNLTAMDYNGLVGASVKLLDFLDALATELNISAGTYGDVLDASAKAGHVLEALARVSQRNGDSVSVSALEKLLLQSSAMTKPLDLGNILGLDDTIADLKLGSRPSGKDATFRIMDLVTAAATLSDGTKQVGVALAANVPGIAKLSLDVVIGEPMQSSPWTSVGTVGATVKTAQTKVRLNVELTAGITVKLPVDIDVAYAEGRLAKIACAADGSGTVTVGAKPGIVTAVIGGTSNSDKVDIATVPVPLLGNVAVTAYTPIQASVGNANETLLTFTQSDIDALIMKTASTNSALQPVSAAVTNIRLGARLAGLEIPVPALVTSTVGAVLNPALTATVDATLFTLLSKLGIRLGKADVIVRGVRCDAALAG